MRSFFPEFIKARATLSIVTILILIHALLWFLNQKNIHTFHNFYLLLGLSKNEFFLGRIWQILSYAFIHGGNYHLLMNALALVTFGLKIENYLGAKFLLLLSLLSILTGGLCFLLSSMGSNESSILVGSSAIAFTYLLAYTTFSPGSKFLPFFLSGKSLGRGLILSSLILSIVNPQSPINELAEIGEMISEASAVPIYQISHACHFGGALVGYLGAKFFLYPTITKDSLRKKRIRQENMHQKP